MRLIDADRLKRQVEGRSWRAKDKMVELIDDSPTIEADPVKHGRWIDADELLRAQFHPLPYTHITPSDVEDVELYQRAWNDALLAVYENAVTIIEAEEE